jgi:hypothetical protein
VKEWSEHEIAALPAKRQRIDRLFSKLVRALREPFPESCRYFTRPPRDDDPPTPDEDMCIVDVEIFLITSPHGAAANAGDDHKRGLAGRADRRPTHHVAQRRGSPGR